MQEVSGSIPLGSTSLRCSAASARQAREACTKNLLNTGEGCRGVVAEGNEDGLLDFIYDDKQDKLGGLECIMSIFSEVRTSLIDTMLV